MNTHIFTVDDMTFLSGLFWYPLSGITQPERMKEVRDLAQEQNFDLYILRSSNPHHVGFARSSPDIKVGISSAAAVISKTLELESEAREFIFVCALPDGKWIYVAQRDGVILPDGDKCFTSEDTAKSRLLEDISLGNWSRIIAPDMWGISGSTERSFEEMLPQSETGKRKAHKWWRLSHVNPYALTEGAKKVLFGAVALLMIAGLIFLYIKYVKEEAPPPEIVTTIQQQVAPPPPPPPPPPEHPWKTMPLSMDLALACLNSIERITLFPGNWSLESARCNRNSLNVNWKAQEYGWIDHIKAIIPDVVILNNGKNATLSKPLPALTIGKDEAVMLSMERKSSLYAVAQRYGIQIVLTDMVQQSPTQAKDSRQPAPPPQDWATVSWKAQDVRSPLLVVDVLDGPGFRLTDMNAVFMNGELVWNLEGHQYVQP
jgi:hypothetical protein